MSPPLIECERVACERDNCRLLHGLDLSIEAGALVYVEGPNGSGKTTLLRTITGLLPVAEGEIRWQGQSLAQVKSDYYAQLIFIGHLPGIKRVLSPREYLAFVCALRCVQALSSAIDDALDKVGLYGYEDTPSSQLSAGQLRRTALAQLYLTPAMIWLLDEPYTAIDQQGIAQLERCFNEHTASGGVVIFTSHQSPGIKPSQRVSLANYVPSVAAADSAKLYSVGNLS